MGRIALQPNLSAVCVAFLLVGSCERGGLAGAAGESYVPVALPGWLGETPGTKANPLGAAAIYSRCAKVSSDYLASFPISEAERSFFQGDEQAIARARYQTELQIKFSVYGREGRIDGYEVPGTAIFLPLSTFFAQLNSQLPASGTTGRKVSAVLSVQVIGIDQGSRMLTVASFDAANPDTLRYDLERLTFRMLRDDPKLWDRSEVVLARGDTLTGPQRVSGVALALSNGAQFPLSTILKMPAASAEARHPGLVVIAHGALEGAPHIGPEGTVLRMRADELELRDICNDQTLGAVRAKVPGLAE